MDLLDTLTSISNRLPVLLPTLQTEEATKNALIMPFIQALGYNVFDPFEVIPEFTADMGTKKNEKVDYVISRDGTPCILIECKSCGTNLNINHASQLFRYFSVTEARFAILTNGVNYQFYTDIDTPNKMDDKPFLEFTIQEIDPKIVNEVKKFAKAHFDENNILGNASELKYKKQIRQEFTKELETPSDEFVKLFAKRVYDGVLTPERREQFTQLVHQAFKEWVTNRVNERLQNAIDSSEQAITKGDEVIDEDTTEDAATSNKDGIITTDDEMEGYRIVRSILSEIIDPTRIILRDTKSYCGVLLDNNNRKPLCRFLFTPNQLTLILLDKDRNEQKIRLDALTDIYKHANELKEYANMYL